MGVSLAEVETTNAVEEAPPRHASSPDDAPLPGTRAWFVFFVLWMTTLAALAQFFLASYAENDGGPAMWAWLLVLTGFYLSLCNVFLPMPTTWIILLAASPHYTFGDAHWAHVVIVALLATAGTVVANLNEYHILAYLLRFGLGRRVRQTRVYGWAARWFDKAPFQLLVLIAFFPIPVDAVRWLAILRRYPRVRFALAYFVGRGARYLIFAGCSTVLALTGRQILAIQLGLVAVALGGRLLWRVIRHIRARGTARVRDAEVRERAPG